MPSHQISILVFPQAFRDNQLTIRTVVLPRVNPRIPLDGLGGSAPAYDSANVRLQAHLTNNPDEFPVLGLSPGPGIIQQAAGVLPANRINLYNALATQFQIVDDTPDQQFKTPGAGEYLAIRKYLPESYRTSFPFVRSRSKFCVSDDSFHCAIKNPRKPPENYQQAPETVSWSKAFAWCLNNYHLSEQMGLIVESNIVDIPTGFFENGGWVYVSLAPDSDYASLTGVQQCYAARIPAISANRPLFAPVVFPVFELAPTNNLDEYLREASSYDDGFCKIVHSNQPISQQMLQERAEPGLKAPLKESGIRLGWDDEQVAIWLNRSLSGDPERGLSLEQSPQLGVFQYRVDVREVQPDGSPVQPDLGWTSLNQVRYTPAAIVGPGGAPQVLEQAMQGFSGEFGLGITPVQLNGDKTGDFWLPMYFTQWSGQSLVTSDDRGHELEIGETRNHPKYGVHTQKSRYRPVGIDQVTLLYGRLYEFRVRLSDLSGGGPGVEDSPFNSALAPSTVCNFRRFVRPKTVEVLNLPQVNDPNNPQTLYQLRRPRLGYPALLFTEFGPETAWELLQRDRAEVNAWNTLHRNTQEIPNINRDFSWWDPDVIGVEIQVEVKTLMMDNLESGAAIQSRQNTSAALTQSIAQNKANYIQLYTTTRSFSAFDVNDPDGLGDILNLNVRYIDEPVLQFGADKAAQIDAIFHNSNTSGEILLPSAREIRITLVPISRPDPLNQYFGGPWVQRGLPLGIQARAVPQVEGPLFTRNPDLALNLSDVWRCFYLQTEPYPTTNQIEQQKASGAVEQSPGDLVQRLAEALDLKAKGMSLLAKPGERAIFSAAKGIRNTLAPDNASITFATGADLCNQWLSVLSLTLHRDWTWDALNIEAFEVRRRQKNSRANTWDAWQTVGHIQLSNTVSLTALENPGPERSYTRLYFLDDVEPKPAHRQFPDTLQLEYQVRALFKTGQVPPSRVELLELSDMTLPVTTPPMQVPKIVAAGVALSPYQHNDNYSATEPRQRYLWIEFEKTLDNPDDTYFARMLNYAPDPMLTNRYIEQHKLLITASGTPIGLPPEPSLPIEPEWIRSIIPNQAEDLAGLGAMQEMIPAVTEGNSRPRHFLLPLPPGIHADANELFGFFVYEFRVGHRNVWSTARARFGDRLRSTGVQHPMPELNCMATFSTNNLVVQAPFAMPVFGGQLPNYIASESRWSQKTRLWALLYTQVKQADGQAYRNVLLGEKELYLVHNTLTIGQRRLKREGKAPLGQAEWSHAEIRGYLQAWGLPMDAALSVLAVELLPAVAPRGEILTIAAPQPSRPLSVDLGKERILRTSPLTPVVQDCVELCVDC